MLGQMTAFQQTGALSGGITYTFTVSDHMGWCKFLNVFMNFSGPVSGDIVVSVDSILGAAFDTVLKTQTLSSATDFVYAPEGEITLKKGDILTIVVPTAVVTYGLYGHIRGV